MSLDRDSGAPLSPSECTALFKILKPHKCIALAVSGGPDSTALMVLCALWAKARKSAPDILVLTVDHGLRSESAVESTRVAEWAERLGLKHKILRWHGEKPTTNIQAAARDARYTLMIDVCLRADIGVLVTAHHLEDQAETFLLRLARGSGVDGLGSMETVSHQYGIKLVRPMLAVPRARFRASLKAIGHPWLSDPSNENERFARVKVRGLQPALDDLGMTSARLVATAQRMRAAQEVLERAADRLARDAVTLDPAGYCVIKHEKICNAPHDTALRVLSRCLMSIGGKSDRPRYSRFEALLSAITDDARCRRTFWGCRIVRRGDGLWVWREAGRNGLPRNTLEIGKTIIWDGRFEVQFGDCAIEFEDDELIVRALEEDGWAQVRHLTKSVPAALGRTFISIWLGNRLVAAPHANMSGQGVECKLTFRNTIFVGSASDNEVVR